MAEVTIRYEPTKEERQVDETAVPFFPAWSVVSDDPTPKRNASADEWRAFVIDRGLADEADVAALSRDELIALVPTPSKEA